MNKAIIFGLVIAGIFLSMNVIFYLTNRSKLDESGLDDLKRRVDARTQKIKTLEEEVKKYKQNMDKYNELLKQKDHTLKMIESKYEKRFAAIPNLTRQEQQAYIKQDSPDSLTLIRHLEERKKCLEENKIIIEMAGILESKCMAKDSIINSTNIMNDELKDDLVKAEGDNKKLIRKNKAKRFAAVIGIGVAIVEGIILILK